jgi:hypothetical protein
MKRGRVALRVAAALFSVCGAAPVFGHGEVMRIGSTQSGSGQLVIEDDFQFELDVHLEEMATVGDQTLYSAIIPSFAWIIEAHDGQFPLGEGVAVSLTIVDIADEAAVRLSGRILNDPNESAVIGEFFPDPEAHEHPEWQLILPTGVVGEYGVTFNLSTNTAGYTRSADFHLTLTNAPSEPTATVTSTATVTATADGATPTATVETTPTATATVGVATPTSSPTGSPAESTPTPTVSEAAATATPSPTQSSPSCTGDCNDDDVVTVNELVRAVGIALAGGSVAECNAADRNASGTITVEELVSAVNAALAGCAAG